MISANPDADLIMKLQHIQDPIKKFQFDSCTSIAVGKYHLEGTLVLVVDIHQVLKPENSDFPLKLKWKLAESNFALKIRNLY